MLLGRALVTIMQYLANQYAMHWCICFHDSAQLVLPGANNIPHSANSGGSASHCHLSANALDALGGLSQPLSPRACALGALGGSARLYHLADKQFQVRRLILASSHGLHPGCVCDRQECPSKDATAEAEAAEAEPWKRCYSHSPPEICWGRASNQSQQTHNSFATLWVPCASCPHECRNGQQRPQPHARVSSSARSHFHLCKSSAAPLWSPLWPPLAFSSGTCDSPGPAGVRNDFC